MRAFLYTIIISVSILSCQKKKEELVNPVSSFIVTNEEDGKYINLEWMVDGIKDDGILADLKINIIPEKVVLIDSNYKYINNLQYIKNKSWKSDLGGQFINLNWLENSKNNLGYDRRLLLGIEYNGKSAKNKVINFKLSIDGVLIKEDTLNIRFSDIPIQVNKYFYSIDNIFTPTFYYGKNIVSNYSFREFRDIKRVETMSLVRNDTLFTVNKFHDIRICLRTSTNNNYANDYKFTKLNLWLVDSSAHGSYFKYSNLNNEYQSIFLNETDTIEFTKNQIKYIGWNYPLLNQVNIDNLNKDVVYEISIYDFWNDNIVYKYSGKFNSSDINLPKEKVFFPLALKRLANGDFVVLELKNNSFYWKF